MIEFNCKIPVDECDSNLTKALCKLIEAYAYLNWPLVIGDTWLRNGQPIPTDLVHKAIWSYRRSHPPLPNGITFALTDDPGFETLLKNLTHCVRQEHPEYKDKFSLTASSMDGRQAEAFAEMVRPKLVRYDEYFDVFTWQWVYNTVYQEHLKAAMKEARKLDPT